MADAPALPVAEGGLSVKKKKIRRRLGRPRLTPVEKTIRRQPHHNGNIFPQTGFGLRHIGPNFHAAFRKLAVLFHLKDTLAE